MDKKQIKKLMVRQSLQSELESTIDQRVERYLEIEHQGIIGGLTKKYSSRLQPHVKRGAKYGEGPRHTR